MLLQNTRFEKGETKNDPELAKQMAALAGSDGVYVQSSSSRESPTLPPWAAEKV